MRRVSARHGEMVIFPLQQGVHRVDRTQMLTDVAVRWNCDSFMVRRRCCVFCQHTQTRGSYVGTVCQDLDLIQQCDMACFGKELHRTCKLLHINTKPLIANSTMQTNQTKRSYGEHLAFETRHNSGNAGPSTRRTQNLGLDIAGRDDISAKMLSRSTRDAWCLRGNI